MAPSEEPQFAHGCASFYWEAREKGWRILGRGGQVDQRLLFAGALLLQFLMQLFMHPGAAPDIMPALQRSWRQCSAHDLACSVAKAGMTGANKPTAVTIKNTRMISRPLISSLGHVC